MPKNNGTLVSSTVRPLSASSSFPTAHSNELLGGYHTVDTVASRNLIPSQRREFGMLVYVTTTEDFYQLKTINSSSLSDNLNWELSLFGGSSVSGGGEWVNSVISITGSVPGTYSVGDRYLVSNGTGLWSGYDDIIVEWDGLAWALNSPSEGTSVKVDDDIYSIYTYVGDDYSSGVWTRLDFLYDKFDIKWNIPFGDSMNVGTNSEYLIYGDLNVDGLLNTYGKVVVINGLITGTGLGTYSAGVVQQVELLTDIISGTGVSITTGSYSTRTISYDIISGTGINIGSSGSSVVISSIDGGFESPKYVIQSNETVVVSDYEEYWIYGDFSVYGTLDIGTYGKVVVANGDFIVGTGSVISNMGNVEVYDLLTVSDDNLKVDITEIKYGSSGRILYESEFKYIPLHGTYARVLTESNKFVYSTSSAYSTSTASGGFENYMGIGTDDPLKKLHVVNSGIMISGSDSEQIIGLSDNYSRFVVDTGSSNTQTMMDLRNDQGRVLWVSGSTEGGNRYPSISIGTSSVNGILNVSDYIGNSWFVVSRTGTLSVATFSNTSSVENFVVWDSSSKELKYRNLNLDKSNFASGASFSGLTDLKYGVTFSSPFSSTNYGVQVTGEVARTWSVENKGLNGFIINSNATMSFTQSVYWLATMYGG